MINLDAFQMASALDLARDITLSPHGSGVYIILIRGGDKLLDATGYRRIANAAPLMERDGFFHLYTGSSQEMRIRLKYHVTGDSRVSTFRKTLLAIEHETGGISALGGTFAPEVNSEVALDRWLYQHALIGTMPTPTWRATEADILSKTASPLNIEWRRSTPFASHLIDLRRAYDEAPFVSAPYFKVARTEFTSDVASGLLVPQPALSQIL